VQARGRVHRPTATVSRTVVTALTSRNRGRVLRATTAIVHPTQTAVTPLTSRRHARVRRATTAIARRTPTAVAVRMRRLHARAALHRLPQMATIAARPTSLRLVRTRRHRGPIRVHRLLTLHRRDPIHRLHAATQRRLAVTLHLRTPHLRARTLRQAAVTLLLALAMAAVAAEAITAAAVVAGDRTIAAAVHAAVILTDTNFQRGFQGPPESPSGPFDFSTALCWRNSPRWLRRAAFLTYNSSPSRVFNSLSESGLS
jgi:hypothetical protein